MNRQRKKKRAGFIACENKLQKKEKSGPVSLAYSQEKVSARLYRLVVGQGEQKNSGEKKRGRGRGLPPD